jgi:phosphohistidine phosphatase
MDLLVIRHAIAVERDEWSGNDDLRPLTDEGVSKMRKGAQGLASQVKNVDVLATSPLVRARKTAEIVARAFEHEGELEEVDALRPDQRPDAFVGWVETHGEKDVVAIVGHEPHLSTLVSWLLTGKSESRLDLKKGGACLVRFEEAPKAGGGQLLWLLTPNQLRALA